MFVDEYRSADVSSERADVVAVNDILRQWHAWASKQICDVGYGRVNATFRGGRTSRQYDDENGSIDAYIDHGEMEAVDHIVMQMMDPYRTALCFLACNLHSGVSVWRSPRLPANESERNVILIEARKKLLQALRNAGIF